MFTDETEIELTSGEVPLKLDKRGLPDFLKISGLGDQLFVGWRDGRVIRYIVRDPENPLEAETLDLQPEVGELTTLAWLLGAQYPARRRRLPAG